MPRANMLHNGLIGAAAIAAAACASASVCVYAPSVMSTLVFNEKLGEDTDHLSVSDVSSYDKRPYVKELTGGR